MFFVGEFWKMKKPGIIKFFFNHPVSINQKKQLKAFLLQICKNENTTVGTISYMFCSDKEILEVNKQFLNHDYYTDIITFQYGLQHTDADIYISIETVLANAKQLKKPFKNELLRVIIHGILHLCGYKDKSKEQKTIMRGREDYYLNLFHVKI